MKKFALALVLILVWGTIATADSPTDGRAGRAELRFLQGMIDHHQMALDMAGDCLNKAQTESLKTLCQNIIDAQSAEIAQMQAWLMEWYNVAYAPVSMLGMGTDENKPNDPHAGHGGNNTAPFTDPPMMMGMMAGLNRLEGTAYDIAWLESMIDHHDDALHMAERLLMRAPQGHAALLTLAEAIIEAQSAEIDMMESMIETLGA